MGPKKRAKQAAAKKQQPRAAASKRRKGILGAATGYNSESDDDYEPSVPKQKPSPAKGKRRRAATPTRSSSDADSSESEAAGSYNSGTTGGSDSSVSGETLAARQQRQRGKLPPSQPAAASKGTRGRPGRRAAAAAAAAAPAVIKTWDQLPTAVLAQIFQAVCKHGALPMAPKLACVCSSWSAAVAATPELWQILDTAAISSRSWAHNSQGCTVSPAKTGRKKGAAAKQLTAEQGLSLWVSSGQLRELQSLLLYGDGASSGDAGDGSSAGVNRQLNAQLLEHIASSCQQLRRLSLFGVLSLRPEELTSVLLSMPALAELWVCGVRFSALSGLTSCICSVLEASAITGIPKLKSLVLEGCVALGQKAVSALCPSTVTATHPQQADTAGDDPPQQPYPPQQQQGAQHPAHGPGSPGTAAAGQAATQAPPAGPRAGVAAFPHLETLDLSQSCTILGRPVKLQLDDMQAAMPNLRVLKLSGVGGFYGWIASARPRAVLPGFPVLESLHVDCSVSAVSGLMKVHTSSSSVTDALLLQLAGQSPKLRALDLTGSLVTPAGLRQLAAAHAACRAAAAAAAAAAGPGLVSRPNAGSGDAARGAGGGSGAGSASAAATGGQSAGALTSAALVGDTAAAAAAGGLHLRDLQINGSALATDEGLAAIGQCCCDTLEQLVVRGAGSKLGDEGLRGLKGCRQLSTLDITGSSVTEAGMSDLLSALPAGVLEDLSLESCRSLSRGARQAAAKGVKVLQQYLADNP